MAVNINGYYVYTGRKPIYTSCATTKTKNKYPLTLSNSGNLDDASILAYEINNAMSIHRENINDIIYLNNIYKGEQDIYSRDKVVRKEIDNRVVLNFNLATTRQINGYTYSKPVVYTPVKEEYKEGVDTLNRYMNALNKSTIDKEKADELSIFGVSYIGIFPSKNVIGANEDIPFSIVKYSAENTFVVYSEFNKDAPMFSVNYTTFTDNNNNLRYNFTVYTDTYYYNFVTTSTSVTAGDITGGSKIDNPLEQIPIIEAVNNQYRLGDWEYAVSITNAINMLTSDSVNDISQFVNSLLVLTNAELPRKIVIDPATGEEVSIIDSDALAGGILELINNTELPQNVDAKYIANQLNSSNVNTIYNILSNAYHVIVGIPDRKTNSDSGGDTGDAVTKRDGWQELEYVANTKEMFYKKAENAMLNIIFNILKIEKEDIGISSAQDLIVKFSRNKTDNLLNKVNAIATLVNSKLISPQDIIEVSEIFLDTSDIVNRGSEFWGEEFANKTVNGQAKENVQKIDKDVNVNV